jgi:tRNA (guanine-N7-)-methyltransferase
MTKKRRVRHHVNPLADRTEHFFEGFENNRPIIVDIGADRGEFTQQLLEQFGADKNFLVLEIRKPLAKKLKLKFKEYENVAVFDGDATRNFKSLLKPSIDRGILIEEIYINFPDPWFKERHKKRRVINEKFINKIKDWIQPETKWIFQTDQRSLFEDTIQVLQSVDEIKIKYLNTSPYNITTKWEDAKTEAGNKIYRLIFYIR